MNGNNSLLTRTGTIGVALLVMISLIAGAGVAVADNTYKIDDKGADEADDEPEAAVTFEDQTTDGASVVVAEASNESGPFYVAVWTLDDESNPETLLGFTQVTDTSAEDVTVELTEDTVEESQTLVAAVHPDQDGDAETVDPDTETILASDTAEITVEEAEDGEEVETDDGEDAEAEDSMDTGDEVADMEVTADDVEMMMEAVGMDPDEVEDEMGMTPQDIADMLNEALNPTSA